MSILFAATSVSDVLKGDVATGYSNDTTAGRRAPHCNETIGLTTADMDPIIFEFPSQSTFWLTFYFYSTDGVWGSGNVVYFLNGPTLAGANIVAVLTSNSSEGFSFQYRTGASTYVNLGTTPAGRQNRLIRFDFQFILDESGGAMRAYVDGALLGELTGDTILTSQEHSTISAVSFSSETIQPMVLSGIIGATTDTRAMVFEQLAVTGAGSNSGFSGTFADVDELGLPNDADFISTITLNNVSTFALENHDSAFNSGFTIEGVVVATRASGENNRFIRHAVLSGGTLGEGTGDQLDLEKQGYQHVFLVDPNTGSAWNNTALNAAEIGVKLTDTA